MEAYLNGSTHRLTAVLEDIEDEPVEAATVSVTLQDATGEEVAGQAWPLVLSAGAPGVYQGTVSHALEVVTGQELKARVVAEKDGIFRRATVPVVVVDDGD